MGKARGVFCLQLLVGAAGAGAVALAFAAAAGQVTLEPPPLAALWAACRSVLLPDAGISGILGLGLGAMAVAVLALAVRSALRQHRASRRFVRALCVRDRRTFDGVAVIVVAGSKPQAFCAGLLRPRIYVSLATLAYLSEDELRAVLAHEQHHARHRDPLRVFLGRVIADSLFFVPAARRLGQRHAALAELAADQAAVRTTGGPAPLASALLSFEAADPAVVGIAPERVDHLLGARARWELPVALLAWAVAAVVAIGAVAVRIEATAATGAPALNLPLLVAQSCMVLMAVGPVALGAGLLARKRLLAT